jgi:TolB-like protein/class 3 adenylate cyclase/tetratricopeptide (TPR) repeat protein
VTDSAGVSRILTLVFTDLADSTALKRQRGDQAVAALISRHRAQVRQLALQTQGHIVDWAGDGCFLTFEAPSAAVAFALHLQEKHAVERDLPGVRVGIHMGEVSERPDGDGGHPRVEGLAVDLAARISSLARPGQVLTSSGVADSARQRMDVAGFGHPIRWQSYGNYSFKGSDEPLEIREVGLADLAPFAAPTASDKARPARSVVAQRWVFSAALVSMVVLAAAAYFVRSTVQDRLGVARPLGSTTGAVDAVPNIPSFAGRPAIAVLPLDNLSPDPAQAFFADGLAEDLITRLSAWRSFPVIARNSSFKYRGGNFDLKKVGVELGARYLVEGSVRRAGDRIRVTAQLVDAVSGDHVWAETYDRDVKDVFTLQDEISSTIAASIVGDVSRLEGERARKRGTENLEAWGLYQMSLHLAYRYQPDDNAKARPLLERAVALDSDFAAALAVLSLTYSWEVDFGWTKAPEKSLAAAFETAHRAVEADPREPQAYLALGNAYLEAGDARNGRDAGQRAVELNPSMPEAWMVLGLAQLLSGDPDGCIAANKKVQRLDPHGEMASVAWDNLAGAYWETGRFDESLDAARHLVAARPTYIWGPLYLALNAVSLGRPDEARAAIAEARSIQPDLSIAKIQRAYAVSRPDVDARRTAALRQAGLE